MELHYRVIGCWLAHHNVRYDYLVKLWFIRTEFVCTTGGRLVDAANTGAEACVGGAGTCRSTTATSKMICAFTRRTAAARRRGAEIMVRSSVAVSPESRQRLERAAFG
jgi:hypothetical protein